VPAGNKGFGKMLADVTFSSTPGFSIWLLHQLTERY
jgi:hypothetical protein